MDRPIRVFVADDHFTVRAGLRWLVEQDPALECVGEADSGFELERLLVETEPDVLVLDLSMPNGFDAAAFVRGLRANYPQIRVLVLTGYDEEELVLSMLQAGAAGYLVKEDAKEVLTEALFRVARGQRYFSQVVAEQLAEAAIAPPEPSTVPLITSTSELSVREEEILSCVGQGMSNAEIATALTISIFTVRSHISRINAKLQLNPSRAELVRFAVSHGFAPWISGKD